MSNVIGLPILPPYLANAEWPANTVPIATLALSSDGKRWVLDGDAQVSQYAKKVFPGAQSLGPGKASFSNSPRIFQELVWLMQRFPIVAREGYEKTLAAASAAARKHAIRRIEAVKRPVAKPGGRFKGMPRPYQSEALAFMLANEKTLVADEPGLGKTVEAIMLLTSTEVGYPALVVCPSHVVTQWGEMMDAFADTGVGGLRVATVVTRGLSRNDVRKGGDVLPDADVYIMHYGLIAYWKERLLEAGLKTVVYDEVGDLRHMGTEKYNACSALASSARHVAGLSGTPIYNYGDEIFSVMSAIDMGCLSGRDEFTREWCAMDGTHRPVIDPRALNAYLRREGLMIRRRKTEVRQQLPNKHRSVESIDAEDSTFRQMMASAVPLLARFKDASRFERFTLSGQIGKETRRATGMAKVASCVAFLTTLLEGGEPIVVYAYHREVVDALRVALAKWNPVCMTGRETEAQKVAAKREFVEGRSQVIILNLRVAQGLDGLQFRCRVGVFCELDWSPAIHTQCEDRLHRDGQMDSVLIYYLVSAVGSDPDMRSKLGLKVAQAKGILDDCFEGDAAAARDEEATKGFVVSMIERLAEEFAGL